MPGGFYRRRYQLEPRETVAVSAHVLCTPHNLVPDYGVATGSHIRRVYVCLPEPFVVDLCSAVLAFMCFVCTHQSYHQSSIVDNGYVHISLFIITCFLAIHVKCIEPINTVFVCLFICFNFQLIRLFVLISNQFIFMSVGSVMLCSSMQQSFCLSVL